MIFRSLFNKAPSFHPCKIATNLTDLPAIEGHIQRRCLEGVDDELVKRLHLSFADVFEATSDDVLPSKVDKSQETWEPLNRSVECFSVRNS